MQKTIDMKVFVGYGYNSNDKWINELVIPFIREFGCEVLTGEEMQGEDLTDGVISRIADSDVCIGFLTRRGKASKGVFSTHSWVISELAVAVTKSIPFFEIREKGVDPQKGITGNRQRYEFDDKAFLLMEIARFLNKERAKLSYKRIMLLPQDFAAEIRPHLGSRDTRCTYKFNHKAKYYGPEETKLEKLTGGFSAIIRRIPSEEALVEITVEGPNGIRWNSGFISVALMNVHLEKI